MDKVWCPRCDKGWVLLARVKQNGETVWLCESCSSLWEGPLKPDRPADATLAGYLGRLGVPAGRDQLEILTRRDEG